MPAVGVKQAQATEVPGAAQLLRGRGQQQDPGGPRRQGRHQVVFRAGGGLRPAQVMGLVDDQQVPVRRQQGPRGGGGGQEACQGAEGQGLDQERVVSGRVLDVPQSLPVEQGEAQVETPPHLHQPLMEQGFRDQDQGPGHAAGGQQPVEDEAGFDGLAESHLIRQQDPGRRAFGDLGGDVELMGDGADPGTHQPQDWRGRGRHAAPPGLVT